MADPFFSFDVTTIIKISYDLRNVLATSLFEHFNLLIELIAHQVNIRTTHISHRIIASTDLN